MMMSKISLDVGKLDKRITVQRHEVITDSSGNQTQEWIDFHSCWAAVNGSGGREYWQARQQHEENTVNFKVRFCLALHDINTVDYRILFDGRAYNITYIDNMLFSGSLLNIKGVETV